MTDDDLLQEITAGGARQSAALKTLYMGKGKAFGRFFLSKGLSRYDADDVLQETFLKILKSAESFRVEGKANAWMWQIARNALMDHYRQKPSETTLDDEGWKNLEVVEHQRRKTANTSADEANWEQVSSDNSVASSAAWTTDPSRAAEECVTQGLARFALAEPDRAYAIELVVEGVEGNEIADRIGRTYTATRQYLTQCRKAFAPFIKDCLPLLAA